ncbi:MULTISPECIES: zinc-finger domain-containing protein [Neobacillus]|uniref:Zinc-finger domain-containing protein n=1 Tax=Neobacillus sedimentimangrovi TaxID=2699460 RepID=A0ABS8QIP3_9BACI|nr:zinc-finger domain-containing protein [Neobacillus sedimentimangrovi]AIM15375.1 hypothetical protein HW35_02965 [Bacillus sp. X1(2014)]MCD4839096.1 zinc-finger domain-containing protein [Neobacillus sedimentimangrovi]
MERDVRKELLSQVENIMNEFCVGCFVHRQLKKECGKRTAHRFCISQCTVGEKIKEFGKKLNEYGL